LLHDQGDFVQRVCGASDKRYPDIMNFRVNDLRTKQWKYDPVRYRDRAYRFRCRESRLLRWVEPSNAQTGFPRSRRKVNNIVGLYCR
jgi:hypothetical protein